MTIDPRLKQVAEKYRIQGYMVVVHPGIDDLPDFANDFKVEIIARREDGCVIVSVKKTRRIWKQTASFPGMRESPRNSLAGGTI